MALCLESNRRFALELGSDYDLSLNKLNTTNDNLFKWLNKFDYVLFDSGRSAIRSVLRCHGEVLLPEYICDSVSNCFAPESVVFYKINEDFSIDCEDLLNKVTDKTRLVYIAHYFGAVQQGELLNCLKREINATNVVVAEDMTQSLFSGGGHIGDCFVASIRKWMPIPVGGVAYSETKLPSIECLKASTDNQRIYAMVLKHLFLNNGLDCNSLYRSIFESCERNFDTSKPRLISDLANFIISCVNVSDLIERRKRNYRRLRYRLKQLGVSPAVTLMKNDVPFVFPIRVNDRDAFRAFLIEHRIYCAVHWPFDGFKGEQRRQAIRNAETLISLPIDQRYDDTHIDFLADVISKYRGDLIFSR